MFGSNLEAEKQRMQFQLSAYGDFVKAQAAWQRAGINQEGTDDQLKELRAAMINPASTDAQLKKMIGDAVTKQASTDASLKLRDTIFRIVFASPADVVRAVANFTELTHKEECVIPDADLAVYQQMRRGIKQEEVTKEVFAMALFGCKLKKTGPPERQANGP
jgi:hypothetical protein